MTDRIAMNWYAAERRELSKTHDQRVPRELRQELPFWHELTERRRDDIRKRVELVLTGEVRRSEMGPGDLAIYFGRYRMLEQSPPDSFFDEHLKYLNRIYRGPGQKELTRQCLKMHRMVWWDCLEFGEYPLVQITTRLFGNAHIGNYNLTNLQVAGQLAFDQTAYLTGWHLSTNEPSGSSLMPILERLLSEGVATMTVGDKPQGNRRLSALWEEPQPLGGIIIPVRQNFGVRMDFYGKGFHKVRDVILDHRRDKERGPLRIWINLEGWQIRPVY